MKFTINRLKPIVLFLSILVLFQCCVVYDKKPVTIEEAVNVDHKIVKPIKVEMEDGERIIVDSLYYKENELFGLELESEVVTEL